MIDKGMESESAERLEELHVAANRDRNSGNLILPLAFVKFNSNLVITIYSNYLSIKFKVIQALHPVHIL